MRFLIFLNQLLKPLHLIFPSHKAELQLLFQAPSRIGLYMHWKIKLVIVIEMKIGSNN